MTVNRIQFLTGLSLPAFLTNFGTDENVRMHWENVPLATRIQLPGLRQRELLFA